MVNDSTSLRILTLNIWGPPFAKQRSERIRAIAARLAELQPDIITLQEVYLEDDRSELLSLISRTWPYFRYFPSGVLGSGLLTLSRYPIVDSHFLKYRMAGKPEKPQHGDYYAGKGIGLTRIQTPKGQIDVYNTHTHAQYEHTERNEYTIYNACNLYEAARFITAHSTRNPLILCGDLNTQPNEIGYRIIQTIGALTDAYAHLHGDLPGITFSPLNAYVDSPPQRLDYIMLRATAQRTARIESIEVVMNETLPQASGALHYSDHYALLSSIQLMDGSNSLAHSDPNQTGPVLDEFIQLLSESLAEIIGKSATYNDRVSLSLSTIPDIFLTGRFVRKILPIPGLRTLLISGVLGVALYHALHSRLNYAARRQTIEAFIDEARLHRQQHATVTSYIR